MKKKEVFFRLEISRSHFSITDGIFYALSHVREIHITSNDIEIIDTGAFNGLYTIGCLTMSDNKIGNISAHAFSTIINIGEIIIERNDIRYLATESLISEAWRTRFRDNILYCGCHINWLKHINVRIIFDLLSLIFFKKVIFKSPGKMRKEHTMAHLLIYLFIYLPSIIPIFVTYSFTYLFTYSFTILHSYFQVFYKSDID
ncbi:unnamed protein product [Onchocerca flexuosa]|uniref:Recep_L_domain domain-containing protein n=1 Tax=Onchocerca flexuosa TaxID=387005 RepID=A0A183HW24_9BILA|nr:unnamed protein product [Onchocerca flexuosa]